MSTTITYSGDGATKRFAVPFPYLAREHVKVTADGVLLTQGTDYSWDEDRSDQKFVVLAVAPDDDTDNVLIRRVTPIAAFSRAVGIIVDDATQTLFALQELADAGLTPQAATEARLAALELAAPLKASGSAPALTGVTAETVLATVSIPAGKMGPNGWIEVVYVMTHTNNANDKTLRLRLGGLLGTAFSQHVRTTSEMSVLGTSLYNINDEAVQAGPSLTTDDSVNFSATFPVAATVDTSEAVDLVITGQLEDAGDSITLKAYRVLVHYRP